MSFKSWYRGPVPGAKRCREGRVDFMSVSIRSVIAVGKVPDDSARLARARQALNASVRIYEISDRNDSEAKLTLPLLSASEFPTAFCHIVARSFVGIPCHQSFRSLGSLCTTFQFGKISRSQCTNESSIRLSRAYRRSCRALRRFSSKPPDRRWAARSRDKGGEAETD